MEQHVICSSILGIIKKIKRRAFDCRSVLECLASIRDAWSIEFDPQEAFPQNRKAKEKKKGRDTDILEEITSNFKHRTCKSIFIKLFDVTLYTSQQISYNHRENDRD